MWLSTDAPGAMKSVRSGRLGVESALAAPPWPIRPTLRTGTCKGLPNQPCTFGGDDSRAKTS
eukprot:2725809-Alexandrium_andersonii.AAC.1